MQGFDAIELSPDDRLLVLECGTGESTRALAARVAQGLAVGLDPGGENVREARRRAASLENIMFVQGSAGEIPWEDKVFTVAITPPLAGDAAEIFRVLAPGARLYVRIPDPSPTDAQRARLQQAGFEDVSVREVSGAALLTATKPRAQSRP